MNGLDFLKSCTTNISGTENALDIAFTVYGIEDARAENTALDALTALLRAQDMLCSLVHDQIWVFGALESEATQLLGPRHALTRIRAEPSISPDTDASPADAGSIRDVFLDAIEASIAFSLSPFEDLVHFGPWQWLYVPAETSVDGDSGVLFRVRAEFTRTNTLLLYLKSYHCCASRLMEFGESQQIMLAPSGQHGRLLSPSTQKQTQSLSGPASEWKNMVASRLASEGINVATGEHWVAVKLIEDTLEGCVWWPLRLCFISDVDHEIAANSIPQSDWRQWFQATVSQDHEDGFHDPLDFAEEWFVNDLQRARAVDSVVEHSLDTMDSTAVSPLATSPPFNQRNADLQAAMLGIYPTPPDGMLPTSIPSLQTTTSDGLNDAPQAMDISQFSDSMELQRTHVEGPLSSNDIARYHGQNDDLFGDIGGIEFGANEVGDADFDYFDEPDEATNFEDVLDNDMDMESEMLSLEPQTEVRQYEHPAASPAKILSNKSSPVEVDEAEMNTPKRSASMDESGPATALLPIESQSRVSDPLSPFHIRERLLPPPVPASANHRPTKAQRRNRTFGPMDFNEGMDFGRKSLYAQYDRTTSIHHLARQDSPHRKIQAARSGITSSDHQAQQPMDLDSSDDESTRSVIHSNDVGKHSLPPSLPWESTKRKRDATPFSRLSSAGELNDESVGTIATGHSSTHDLLLQAYRKLFAADESRKLNALKVLRRPAFPITRSSNIYTVQSAITLASVDAFFQFTKADLTAVAQLITEQALSTNQRQMGSTAATRPLRGSVWNHKTANVHALVEQSIKHVISDPEDYSIDRLLPVREVPPVSAGNSRTNIPGQALQGATASMQSLPAAFPIVAPYLRMQRGPDSLDVFPSALPFWQALGLGPASDSKDIEILLVLPDGENLLPAVENFMTDLRQAYEGCKLGNLSRAGAKGHQDGIVFVSAPEGEPLELVDIVKAYAARCSELGRSLAESEDCQPDQTTVVCLINPFEEDSIAMHYLCACFWQLYQAYRESTKTGRQTPSRDVVLQIIPVSLIASPTEMVYLGTQQLAALAMEIYDRCPPSSKIMANNVESSTLSIFAAPALHLANFTHRRIGLQPTAEPPSDLLQEGSILHVAYALSDDEQWMTICWIGSGGRSQRGMSLSLRGKSFSEVAACVWEQTLEIIAARDVMWRVFLTTANNIHVAVKECWKRVVTARPRKQMLHVTLLALDEDPPMQLTPEQVNENNKSTASATTPGGGFLTPASTPQAAAFTVSPDASGATNAPLTPAPSDGTAGLTENDPDAYLMELADEAWGVLLSPSVASSSPTNASAGTTHGLLLRRGTSDDEPLEALGVELLWDIRVRPNGFVDDGHPMQTESSLREVLKLYRYLCLLANARGLQPGDEFSRNMLIPVHVLYAAQGARALDGLMRPHQWPGPR